jgi:hypothetical protein
MGGLQMTDSQCQTQKPIKAKIKLPAKCRLVDLDGTTHEWTDRGLPTKVFKQHFYRGHAKESCLIMKPCKVSGQFSRVFRQYCFFNIIYTIINNSNY